MKEIIKILERINSVAILFIIAIFFFGSNLLLKSPNFNSPSAIGGFLLIGFGLLYSIFAYSFNQLHENYKSIIKNYNEIIKHWRSSAREREFEKTSQNSLKTEIESRKISEDWRREAEEETTTS